MIYTNMAGMNVSRLGFGCMRFPKNADGSINEELSEKMLLRAHDAGVNYFDTAVPYHAGKSEPFLGSVLRKLPRDSYYVATKLPVWKLNTYEECVAEFNAQLERLGTGHIDFFLLHALGKERWEKVLKCGVLSYLEQMKSAGKIKRLGFSFHDSFDVFEQILTYRKWDFCQIQFNYMDTEHQAGLRGLELAKSLGIPVVIMEPLKGGALTKLPAEVAAPLRALDSGKLTDASYAMRFIEQYDNAKVILSGMSDEAALEDNLKTFDVPRPLSDEEKTALAGVVEGFRRRTNNGCTGCRYCVPCPNGVAIPNIFAVWNAYARFDNLAAAKEDFGDIPAAGRPDKCINCGQCVKLCPQGLDIPGDLKRVLEETWAK